MLQENGSSTARPVISVVVPVYNVEEYLAECLASIAAQTFDDFEVLCVNDGSTDGSLEIMRAFEQRDPRFRVLDKPNGGYGHSVNYGLDHMRGDYLSIIEPDDFITPYMFEDLLQAAQLPDGTWVDVVKSSYWEYFNYGGQTAPGATMAGPVAPARKGANLMGFMPKVEVMLDLSVNCEVLYHHPSIWTALYRVGFIRDAGIRMVEVPGAGWADNPWFYETMLQAKTIKWVPHAYYYYRQTNPNSSSKKLDYHVPLDRLRDLDAILKRLGITDKRILEAYYNRMFNYILSTLLQEQGYSDSDPEFRALVKETLANVDVKILQKSAQGILHRGFLYYCTIMDDSAEAEGSSAREGAAAAKGAAAAEGAVAAEGADSPEGAAAADVQAAKDSSTVDNDAREVQHVAGAAVRDDRPLAVSYVLCMQDDLAWVIDSCGLLANRKVRDWEVLLAGNQATPDVIGYAEELAASDGRYTYLGSFDTHADAFNAGLAAAKGDFVVFFEHRAHFAPKINETVVRAIHKAQDSDVILFTDVGEVFRCFADIDRLLAPGWDGKPRYLDKCYGYTNLDGKRALLAASNAGFCHRVCHRRSFLEREGLVHSPLDSENGWGFLVQSLVAAQNALGLYENRAFVGDAIYPPDEEKLDMLFADEFRWIDYISDRLPATYEGTCIKHACQIASLNIALRRWSMSTVFKDMYMQVKQRWDAWGLENISPRTAVDGPAYYSLEKAMGEESFEKFLLAFAGRVATDEAYATLLAKHRWNHFRETRESKSYILGNLLMRPTKMLFKQSKRIVNSFSKGPTY